MKKKKLSINDCHIKTIQVIPERWEGMKEISEKTGIKLYVLLDSALELFIKHERRKK